MNNELMKLSLEDLTSLLTSWGHPRFRGKQVHEWVHKHHASSYEEMTNIPQSLREALTQHFPLSSTEIADLQRSVDGSRKYLIRLEDDLLVETVGLPSYDRNGSVSRLSVCVSSQVGCPMACSFCATGKEGLSRNLTAHEIVNQVATVQKDFNHRVSNVVVMGQGEPFLNYGEVIGALRVLNDPSDFKIGARHITLSSCGILSGIEQLAREPEQFTLAISLHSAVQETRDLLMPRVSNQPLRDLKPSLKHYQEQTKRRVSFEYLLLDGVNDDQDHLEALRSFCKELLVHVNLLPMNAVEGSPLQPSKKTVAKKWLDSLNDSGIETTMRVSRGSDIAGACGQLKNSFQSYC